MKYLKIILDPKKTLKLKGDPEDRETLQCDLYEKLTAMIEAETLDWDIDEEEDDEELDC